LQVRPYNECDLSPLRASGRLPARVCLSRWCVCRKNLATNTVTFIVGFAFYLPALSAGTVRTSSQFVTAQLPGFARLCTDWHFAILSWRVFWRHSDWNCYKWWHDCPQCLELCGITNHHRPGCGLGSVVLNGSATPLINSTSLNTRASANSYGNVIQIGDFSDALPSGIYYDDLRVFDTTAAMPIL